MRVYKYWQWPKATRQQHHHYHYHYHWTDVARRKRKSDNRLNKFISYAKQWKDFPRDEKWFRFCFGLFSSLRLYLIIRCVYVSIFCLDFRFATEVNHREQIECSFDTCFLFFLCGFSNSNFKLEFLWKEKGTTLRYDTFEEIKCEILFCCCFVSNKSQRSVQSWQSASRCCILRVSALFFISCFGQVQNHSNIMLVQCHSCFFSLSIFFFCVASHFPCHKCTRVLFSLCVLFFSLFYWFLCCLSTINVVYR